MTEYDRFTGRDHCTKPRPAAIQGIVRAFVQAANSRAVVSFLVNFEMGTEKKFRIKLLDREADSVGSVIKTSVSHSLSYRSPIAGGEKLRLGFVIKSNVICLFDLRSVCHLIILQMNEVKLPVE